jgi:hypothetical protein
MQLPFVFCTPHLMLFHFFAANESDILIYETFKKQLKMLVLMLFHVPCSFGEWFIVSEEYVK